MGYGYYGNTKLLFKAVSGLVMPNTTALGIDIGILPSDIANAGIPNLIEDANQNGIIDPGETNPLIPSPDGDLDWIVGCLNVCLGYDDKLYGGGDCIPNCNDSSDTDGDVFTDADEMLCRTDPANINSRCATFIPWRPLLLFE